MSAQYALVLWEEDGFTSVVKASQVLEQSLLKKGSKATVNRERKNLRATIIDIGNKVAMKKREKEFHRID